jgi:hypothetical protein
MPAGRQAVNGSVTSVGFTTKLVTVQSVSPDGKTAVCVDRQNTQVSIPMMVQRSKGVLPAVGETWLATQDLGQWTFAAFVGTSASDFQNVAQSSGVYTGSTAPGTPTVGELWVNSSLSNIVSVWNGTQWEPLQFGAVAIQPGSLTGKQLAEEANIAASQVNFTASDIGGITTTISATAPSSPSFGDLWYDAENGYQLNQWTGTQWIPYQWGTQSIAARAITTQLLAAEAVTADELAAGIVYAGIINGTIVDAPTFIGSTFEGQDFILNTAGGYWYTTTPGLGDLVVSITSTGGTDPQGNTTQGGVTVYQGNARIQMHVNTSVGAPALEMLTGVASALGGSALYCWVPNPGATTEKQVTILQGPTSAADGGSVFVEMDSASADGSSEAVGFLVSGGTGGAGAVAEWDVTGFRSTSGWQSMSLQNGWGLHSGSVARFKKGLDNTVKVHFTNVSPGSFGDGTVVWNIPSGYVPSNGATQNIPLTVGYTTAPAYGSTPIVAVRSNGTMTVESLRGTPASVSFIATYFLD